MSEPIEGPEVKVAAAFTALKKAILDLEAVICGRASQVSRWKVILCPVCQREHMEGDDCATATLGAEVVLISDSAFAQFQWKVLRCPFCSGQHLHGGGLGTGDPRKYLSPRTAPCGGRRGQIGYVLFERSATAGA
jgi:hypothetical protein